MDTPTNSIKDLSNSGHENKQALASVEIKLLTEKEFDDFKSILEELNEEPLPEEIIQRLRADFIDERFKSLMLNEGDKIAGIAIIVDSYSAVHARKVLNLDELYIREAFRGKDLGKALFNHVIEYAQKEKYMRLEWRAEKDNYVAHNLYSQYAANTNWTWYGLEL
jgi:GNAT superfamily N-acetyltransferase